MCRFISCYTLYSYNLDAGVHALWLILCVVCERSNASVVCAVPIFCLALFLGLSTVRAFHPLNVGAPCAVVILFCLCVPEAETTAACALQVRRAGEGGDREQSGTESGPITLRLRHPQVQLFPVIICMFELLCSIGALYVVVFVVERELVRAAIIMTTVVHTHARPRCSDSLLYAWGVAKGLQTRLLPHILR